MAAEFSKRNRATMEKLSLLLKLKACAGQRVTLLERLVWSAGHGKLISPCLRNCLRIWSRETSSAVPSRVSLLIFHTQAESGAYSRDSTRFLRRRSFIYLNRHTPLLGQCRLYRLTQLRANDVHCRESAGTGPVVLKIVPVTGAAILQVTMDQLICAPWPNQSAPLFSHTYYWYEVGMFKEDSDWPKSSELASR